VTSFQRNIRNKRHDDSYYTKQCDYCDFFLHSLVEDRFALRMRLDHLQEVVGSLFAGRLVVAPSRAAVEVRSL